MQFLVTAKAGEWLPPLEDNLAIRPVGDHQIIDPRPIVEMITFWFPGVKANFAGLNIDLETVSPAHRLLMPVAHLSVVIRAGSGFPVDPFTVITPSAERSIS